MTSLAINVMNYLSYTTGYRYLTVYSVMLHLKTYKKSHSEGSHYDIVKLTQKLRGNNED